MNDKTFRIARLIRLAIILGILFSFTWMLRWDIGTITARGGSSEAASYTKLDRWTGATYICSFRIRVSGDGPICRQEL